MLFIRGLKGVNLSCSSPVSTAVGSATPDRCRSLAHLRSPFALPAARDRDKSSQKQPQLPSASSSSRYLLDEELDELFDAELLPSLQLGKVEGSRSTATATAAAADASCNAKNLLSDGHVDYLRSAKAAATAFYGGDRQTSWVRFHTVDGGESAALSRVSWPRDGEGSSRRPVKVVKLDVEDSDDKATRSDQVVVLRVSLHCKACEGKVRKHISRMPGVKSFNIDFASKKVTVIGDVTPLGVLASISKVKNAQLWPSPPPPPLPRTASSDGRRPWIWYFLRLLLNVGSLDVLEPRGNFSQASLQF